MDSKFANAFSTLPRYILAASGSKTFQPDAIASSSSVGGSVQSLRMRYSLCIAGKCVLRWLMRPKSDLWELMCMKVKWDCSPFKLYFIAQVTMMILFTNLVNDFHLFKLKMGFVTMFCRNFVTCHILMQNIKQPDGGIQKNTALMASTNLNVLCDVDLGNELLCCLVLYRHALLYWIECTWAWQGF